MAVSGALPRSGPCCVTSARAKARRPRRAENTPRPWPHNPHPRRRRSYGNEEDRTTQAGPTERTRRASEAADTDRHHDHLRAARPYEDMRFFLSEFLGDVAAEIEGEGLSSDKAASIFTVHVGPPRKEWKQ
jgi:hypothetical protein